jgi:hypothetical protein
MNEILNKKLIASAVSTFFKPDNQSSVEESFLDINHGHGDGINYEWTDRVSSTETI